MFGVATASDGKFAKKAPIGVTPQAKKQIVTLLEKRGKPSVGIKIGVRTRGCSGLSYTIEYADEIGQYDEVVEFDSQDMVADDLEGGEDNNKHNLKVIIDPKAIMFVIGTEMDFVEEKLQSGFVFRNPNEKGRCGCGDSFHV